MPYPTLIAPTFSRTNLSWMNFLHDNGYVVLENILTVEERRVFWETFIHDFQCLTPDFKFNDTDTWCKNTYPGMFDKGICTYNGIGQANFSWFIRTRPCIKEIFSKLFDTDDLMVSMDAFSLFFSNSQISESWHHIDQNPRSKLLCYQGAYNYFKVGENDAGFVCAPKSHLHVPSVSHKRNWVQIPSGSPWNQKVIKLLIPENSFVIWNSRTIHANTGMTHQHKELNRLSVLINMLPRSYSNKEYRERRIEIYKKGLTSNHWANKASIIRPPKCISKEYETKNINTLTPTLDNGCIPIERKQLL